MVGVSFKLFVFLLHDPKKPCLTASFKHNPRFMPKTLGHCQQTSPVPVPGLQAASIVPWKGWRLPTPCLGPPERLESGCQLFSDPSILVGDPSSPRRTGKSWHLAGRPSTASIHLQTPRISKKFGWMCQVGGRDIRTAWQHRCPFRLEIDGFPW